ncbi:hypothetical protein D3C76_1587460 [compost metagenome]
MQRTLLQRLQLTQYIRFAVRTQRQGAQVLGLGPDTLCGIPDATTWFEVEHGPHRTGLLIDAQLLGKGEGPFQIGMQG